MKIAIVGGGSTYTPELMEGLIARAAGLGLSECALMDIDDGRLAPVAGFCRRMTARAGADFRITTTAGLDEALDGASFVLTQVRVGGQAGRHKDIRLGLRHGLVGQETTGVGGFAKALRTVPVMLDVCRRMERLCPRAWLINFTNPSGLVTEAMLKHGRERVIGLCNIPVNIQLDIADHLGVDPGRLELDSLGLNHLSWVRRVLLDGRDVLPALLDRLMGAGRPANMPEELDYPPAFVQALGMVPSSYLRFYYLTRRVVQELEARPQSRAEEVFAIEQELWDIYRDPRQDEKPALLGERGGAYYSRAALDLLEAIHFDRGARLVVDTRNRGAIACLPDDCTVEVPCRVDAAGACPLPLDPPQPAIRGLMQHVKAYEELAVEAAVHRSRRLALLALVAHPLVADAELAVTLVDEICTDHAIQLDDDPGPP